MASLKVLQKSVKAGEPNQRTPSAQASPEATLQIGLRSRLMDTGELDPPRMREQNCKSHLTGTPTRPASSQNQNPPMQKESHSYGAKLSKTVPLGTVPTQLSNPVQAEPTEPEICVLLDSVNDSINRLATDCARGWPSLPNYEQGQTLEEAWVDGQHQTLMDVLCNPVFEALQFTEPGTPDALELLRIAYQIIMVERLSVALQPFVAALPESYDEGVAAQASEIVKQEVDLRGSSGLRPRKPYGVWRVATFQDLFNKLTIQDNLDNIEGYAIEACTWCFYCTCLLAGEDRLIWDSFRDVMLPGLEEITREVFHLSYVVHGMVSTREYTVFQWYYPAQISEVQAEVEVKDDSQPTTETDDQILCTTRMGLECSSCPDHPHGPLIIRKAGVLTKLPVHPLTVALGRIRHLQIAENRVSIADISILGPGGFGDVRRGFLDGSVAVAIKALRPTGDVQRDERTTKRLVREINVWAQLDHPNILPFLGFSLSADLSVAWLVSPLCSHGNAMEYLNSLRKDQNTELTRLSLILDTAQGLKYLHEFQPPIVHGDLKAANVLITDDIRAVIGDFGLSKVRGQKNTGLSTENVATGTIRYISPEVAFGEREPCPESDIWAWGCLVLEILLQQIPYVTAVSIFDISLKICDGEPPADVNEIDVAAPIAKLMQQCWSFDPDARPTASKCAQVVTDHYRRRQVAIQIRNAQQATRNVRS